MIGDVIIVGGGLAGLFCALKLAPRPVTLITAGPLGIACSSAWAQGGIAAAVAEDDTSEAHARDTIVAGVGIVDAPRVRSMTREAPERVQDLVSYGVPFDCDPDGRFLLSREAGHSARRIVRVRGDRTGHAIMAALTAVVTRTPTIEVLSGYAAEDLITKDGNIIGLWARSAAENKTVPFLGRALVLATGGIGSLYAVTTNPPDARGTGLAIAARAGAVVSDVEFVQFHPTAIAIERNPAPLATEAIRGEGAVLVNDRGERFMKRVHPDAELAPRDIVARGVFSEIAAGRGAFLDARAAIGDSFRTRFPSVYEICLTAGIDPLRQLIPITPAEHYQMGGTAVDERGRTSLPGLWAAGEVAATGVHGANRLASNSLLEAVVFGARVAEDISGISPLVLAADGETSTQQTAPAAPIEEQRIRTLMNAEVGVVRDRPGLARAVLTFSNLEREATSSRLRNISTAALLIAAAAHERRESRGAHFRRDCEHVDPARQYRSMLTLEQARRIAERVESVG